LWNSSLTVGGPFLDLTNSPLDLGTQPVVMVGSGSTLGNTAGPVIRIRDGLLAADALVWSDGTGNIINLTGTVLDLSNSMVTLRTVGDDPEGSADTVTLTLATGEPAVRLTYSSLTLTGSDVSLMDFGTDTGMRTQNGVALIATSSEINIAGPLLRLGNLNLTDPNPQVQLTDSSITQTGTRSLIEVGGPVTLAGSVFDATNSDLTVAKHLLQVRDGATLTATTTEPLLQFSGSTVGMDGGVFNMGSGVGQPGSTATLAGPLLSATNSDFDTGPQRTFVSVFDGGTFTSTTTDPLLTVSGGSITTKGHVVRIGLSNAWSDAAGGWVPIDSQDPVSMTLTGPLLKGTDTDITATKSVLTVRDRGTFKSTSPAPLIQLGGTTGSTLTLGGPEPDTASPTFGQQVNSAVFQVQPVLTAPFSASAELAGPVLKAENTTISTTDRILGVFGGTGASATLTSHTPDPLVQLTGGSVTMSGTFYPPTTTSSGTYTDTSGSFLRMSSPDSAAPATLSLAGPLLSATSTTFDGHNHFIRIGRNAQLTSTGTGPLVQLTGTNVSISGTETFTPTSGSPTTYTFGDFVSLSGTGAGLTVAGPLVNDSGSTFDIAGQFFQVRDASVLASTTALPLLQLSNSRVTAAGNFLGLSTNAPTMTLAGPVLSASNSSLKNGDPTSNDFSFIWVGDSAQLKSTSTSPLLSFDASTVDTAGNILTLRHSNSASAPSKVTLAGPLFSATNNSSFNTTTLGSSGGACCSGFYIGQGAQLTSSTLSPLIQITNSTFNAGPDAQSGGSFFSIHDGAGISGLVAPSSVNIAGPLLSATDSTITALYNLVGVTRSSLTSTSIDPLIQLGGTTGSTVTLGGTRTDPLSPGSTAFGYLLDISGSSVTPATMSLEGPLLKSTNATITATSGALAISSGASLSSATLDPLVQLTGGGLTLAGTSTYTSTSGTSTYTTGHFLSISSPDPAAVASLTMAGPLLKANNTPISAHDHFLNIGSNVTVNGTGTGAAVQLTNSPLTVVQTSTFTPSGGGTPSTWTNGILLSIYGSNAAVTLAGPLLSATDSALTLGGSIVHIESGGRLTSTTTDSLIKLTGGTHDLGTGGPASLLDLHGVNTDLVTGLGTDSVLQTGGPIIETNGATVNLAGTGSHAIFVDRALLEASAPIIKLINSTMNTSSSGAGLMNLYQSNVTSLGPVFGLDNSTLTVNSGPLLSVTGGTNMTVTGDFASLSNGSKITVQNGPMILVDGVNTKGTASTLTVTGALVNFGGTGGNQVIINNTITPNLLPSGVPVSVTGSGSSVTIGPNPIKNPSLGAFSVTGSAIQATNGGRVTITAP
jgi:hypothetical protein